MHASGLRRKRGSMSGKRRMRTGGEMRGGRKGSTGLVIEAAGVMASFAATEISRVRPPTGIASSNLIIAYG